MLKCFWRGLIPYFGGLAVLGTRGTQTKFGVALSGEMRYQFLIHNGFFLNKQGWRTATHPERQRTEKQGFSQYPSGWCEARGYDIISTNKGGIRIKRSEATEGDSGKPFPVPLRAVAKRLGDTTIGISTIKGGLRHPLSLRYQDSNLDRQNQNL